MRDVPQSPRHAEPDGRIRTVPAALCDRVTVSEHLDVNLAVTLTGDVLALVATVQVPVPLQPPPDQPVNR